jgi:hypothetical protein
MFRKASTTKTLTSTRSIRQRVATSMPGGVKATGKVLGTKCGSSGSDNAGCAFKDTDNRSYGKGFNNAGGGVYAHLWDDGGIKMWHFARTRSLRMLPAASLTPSSGQILLHRLRPVLAKFLSSSMTTSSQSIQRCAEIGPALPISLLVVLEHVQRPSRIPRTLPVGGNCLSVYDLRGLVHHLDAKWKINYIAGYN